MILPKFIYILQANYVYKPCFCSRGAKGPFQFNGKGKASPGLLLLFWPRCCQTPLRISRKDPNPICRFDPLVMQTASCFSCEKIFSSLHFGRISGHRKYSLISHLTFIGTGKAIFGLLFIYTSQCCCQTPLTRLITDPNPMCHFDPLPMQIGQG